MLAAATFNGDRSAASLRSYLHVWHDALCFFASFELTGATAMATMTQQTPVKFIGVGWIGY